MAINLCRCKYVRFGHRVWESHGARKSVEYKKNTNFILLNYEFIRFSLSHKLKLVCDCNFNTISL